MKTFFTCPQCQKTFKETSLAAEFNAKCPHCGAEVIIPADPTKAELASRDAREKAEAEKKRAELKAKDEAERAAQRQKEEADAQAVALIRRSVKRVCPHCGGEGRWQTDVRPDAASFVVRCEKFECQKKFTVLNSADEPTAPLTDILKALKQIRFLMGVITVFLLLSAIAGGILFFKFHHQ